MSANDRQIGGSHYQQVEIQPWDAMAAWMTKEEFVGFLKGNAIKYLARANLKGGAEDIRKARHYLDKLIETAFRVECPECDGEGDVEETRHGDTIGCPKCDGTGIVQ